MLNIMIDLRMCITQTEVISLALLPEPTSFYLKVADGDDEDLMGIENPQLEQATIFSGV